MRIFSSASASSLAKELGELIKPLIPTPSLGLRSGQSGLDALSGAAAPVLQIVLLPCVHEVHGQTGLSALQLALAAWLAPPTPLGLLPARFPCACIQYFFEYILYS